VRILTDRGIAFGYFKVFGKYFWRHDRNIQILFGKGAGYIGGSTLFVAVNCKSPFGPGMYRRKFLQVGWTTNANKVPFCSH
jgi:hypothetical protein